MPILSGAGAVVTAGEVWAYATRNLTNPASALNLGNMQDDGLTRAPAAQKTWKPYFIDWRYRNSGWGSNQTKYIQIDGSIHLDNACGIIAPVNLTFKMMCLHLSTAPGAGQSQTLDLLDDGVSVANITISGSATEGYNATEVTIVAGSDLLLRLVASASAVITELNILVVLTPA